MQNDTLLKMWEHNVGKLDIYHVIISWPDIMSRVLDDRYAFITSACSSPADAAAAPSKTDALI